MGVTHRCYLKNPADTDTLEELPIVEGSVEWKYNSQVKGSGTLKLLIPRSWSYLDNFTGYDIRLTRDFGTEEYSLGDFIPVITGIDYSLPSSTHCTIEVSFYEYSFILQSNEMTADHCSAERYSTKTEVTTILGWCFPLDSARNKGIVYLRPNVTAWGTSSAPSWKIGDNTLTVINGILSGDGITSIRSTPEYPFYVESYVAPGNKPVIKTASEMLDLVIDGAYHIDQKDLGANTIICQSSDSTGGSSPNVLQAGASSYQNAQDIGFYVTKTYTGVDVSSQAQLQRYANARLSENLSTSTQGTITFDMLLDRDVAIGTVVQTAHGKAHIMSIKENLAPGSPAMMSVTANLI